MIKSKYYSQALILTIPLLLVSCGGSSTTNTMTQTQTINGVTVPYEPDPVENTSTLRGIDSNSNGIRDDIEIEIAKDFGDDAERHDSAMSIARIETEILVNPTRDNIDKLSALSYCSILSYEEQNIINSLVLDTLERRKAYGDALAGSFYNLAAVEATNCETL